LVHVIAAGGTLRALQRIVAPIHIRLPGGCHNRPRHRGHNRAHRLLDRAVRTVHARRRPLRAGDPHVLGTALNRPG
jgi:hypothetical protein